MTKRVSCMECANYKNVKRLNICKANNDTMSDYYAATSHQCAKYTPIKRPTRTERKDTQAKIF